MSKKGRTRLEERARDTCRKEFPPPLVLRGRVGVGVECRSAHIAASYQVWRSMTDDVSTATRIATGLTTDFFNDTTASSGITYYYWVCPKNAVVGVGLFSAVESGELT
jgi:hypothetical protein